MAELGMDAEDFDIGPINGKDGYFAGLFGIGIPAGQPFGEDGVTKSAQDASLTRRP
jgi:hypothetical protein